MMMRHLYTLIFFLLIPLIFLRLAWRGLKNKDYWRGWLERLGLVPILVKQQRIWIHAASVGEMRATLPLITALRKKYPKFAILLTTITPTGAKTARELYPDIQHTYLPYDLPCSTHQFIKRVCPNILLVMETELWPNLFQICQQKGIKVILVNGRLSENSMRGYQYVSSLIRETLANIQLIAAQTTTDAEHFITLGKSPKQITITGNLKFDQPMPKNLMIESKKLRQYFSLRPIWIAASTHFGEEEQILAAHQKIRSEIPTALLILTPRHPERFKTVATLSKKHGFNTLKYSDKTPCKPETAIFLLDVMGRLMYYYAVCDIAFIGGSLVNHGGQNVLEAAKLGCPILTGPNIGNFLVVNKILQTATAAKVVFNSDELAKEIIYLFQHPKHRKEMGHAGQRVVQTHQGSTQRLMQALDCYLPDTNK